MNNRNLSSFKFYFASSMVVFLLSAIVIGATSQEKGQLRITRVKLDEKSFNPLKDEAVTLSFEISRQADVDVTIYDRLGRKVRGLALRDVEAGRQNVRWDGRKTNGKLAPGDVFLYVVEARGEDGAKATYNPAPKTGGLELKPVEYTLDRKTGEIEFVLPKTSAVRIRAGLKDGMYTGSLLDWVPLQVGRHAHKWDGKDSSGYFNLLRHRDLELKLACYTLPTNSIIVTGDVIDFEAKKIPFGSDNQQREQVWATKDKYMHYKHDPRICHSPRFRVLFPTGTKTEDADTKVAPGLVPIRVELDKRDARHLISTRFEVMFFIDGVYIYEVEEGSSPFTFNWETKGFGKGPHLITVNLIAYDDHVGVLSRKVIIRD